MTDDAISSQPLQQARWHFCVICHHCGEQIEIVELGQPARASLVGEGSFLSVSCPSCHGTGDYLPYQYLLERLQASLI